MKWGSLGKEQIWRDQEFFFFFFKDTLGLQCPLNIQGEMLARQLDIGVQNAGGDRRWR